MNKLSNAVESWVLEVLKEDEDQHNEEVTWDIGLMVAPDIDPEDPQGVITRPALVLYLELPLEGTENSVTTAPILAPIRLTKEVVQSAVRESLTKMRDLRDASLTKSDE